MEIQAEVAPLEPVTQDWILKKADEGKLRCPECGSDVNYTPGDLKELTVESP
jgi:hypothetical protein